MIERKLEYRWFFALDVRLFPFRFAIYIEPNLRVRGLAAALGILMQKHRQRALQAHPIPSPWEKGTLLVLKGPLLVLKGPVSAEGRGGNKKEAHRYSYRQKKFRNRCTLQDKKVYIRQSPSTPSMLETIFAGNGNYL